MEPEAQLIAAFATALLASFALTPVAIFLGHRTGFCDQPGTGIAYKIHTSPTPYLGGVAVIAGFLLSSAFGSDLGRLWPLLAASVALVALGTVDDRFNLSPRPRLVAEFAMASGLWSLGLGWEVFDQRLLDLLATNLWVVGVANAFNLMDNMDGVTATVASVTSLAAAVLAAGGGDVGLAVLSAGLAGACAGFLPWNARPARIFLGDGGSLPIGFVIAVVVMLLPNDSGSGVAQLLLAPVLVGLPLVDTILRMTWRHRAGVPFLQGGKDSLTHILQRRLGSPDHVAWFMGAIQGVLAAVAIGVAELGRGSVVFAWSLWFVTTTACVVLLERHAWGEPPRAPGEIHAEESRGPRGSRVGRVLAVEAAAILFIAISCGLSPALYGFYRLGVWGPIALVLLAGLLGLLIARPAAPRRTALVAIAGLTFLWLWSLLSSRWAESADQAMTDANRWMLYAALFAILVLLLRDDRLGKLLIGCAGAAVAAFGGYLVVRLLGPAGNELFLANRLHDPLGYINGQAGYLMLGLWPLIALAERANSHVLSGAAVSGATLLGGLAVLGQTRAIVPAVVVSAIVLVAVLPGRRQRVWALVAVGCGVGLAAAPLVDVYESGRAGGLPDSDTVRAAVLALLGSSALSGAVWALARWGAARAGDRVGRRRLTALSAAGIAAVVIAVLAAGFAAAGNPAERVRDEWRAFKSPGTGSTPEARSRFTTGSGNRYDYWRVAVNQFEDDPLKGLGAGNYDRTYFVERTTNEDIRQPHSLPLQALAELGIVGLLGVLLFLAAVLAGFTRRARAARTSTTDLGLAVAGGGMFLVWIVHTSVDWLHLIPGITGIALCGAAVLVAPWTRSAGATSGFPLRIATIAACALLVLLGATLVGRSALADKYRSDSQELVEADPRAALVKAEDSLDLNDESLPAYYAQAAAYARMNDYERARASLLEATRREPHDFVSWALLGDLAVRRGDERQARRDYRRALRLNPNDNGLREVVAAQ